MALHTYRATLWTFKALLVLSLSGCSLFQPSSNNLETRGPVTQVFEGSYDEVWRSVQKALIRYPIRINNIDEGIIETEQIRGSERFTPPPPLSPYSPSIRYRLKIQAIRGVTAEDTPSVKVRIQKEKVLRRDFITEEEHPSDGLEEKSLLYRIGRELQIERGLRRAFEEGKI